MMVQDGDGYWTGDVRCDHKDCKADLSQGEIRLQSLLERRWFCLAGRHYCENHHPDMDALPEEEQKYAAYWQERLAGSVLSQEAGTSCMPATPAA